MHFIWESYFEGNEIKAVANWNVSYRDNLLENKSLEAGE
jgi:hypothetical protein